MSGKAKNNIAGEPDFQGMVRITSLGCPKNFVDTELASASFLCAGFGLAADDESADIQFINTCAFLKEARKEASSVIQTLKSWKRKKKGRLILVAGCLVEWAKKEDLAEFPFVDYWIPIDSAAEAGKIATALLTGALYVPEKKEKKRFLYSHETPRVQLTPPHYAYIKIADGCDNRCAYCMIPSIRGPLRSRTAESVVKEAKSLIEAGVKELILIAQDSGAFGRDLHGQPELAGLLRKLDKLPGDFRLRLMYLHPASVTPELLDALKKSVHLIRCVEMPIQHISDPVLRAMNRKVFEERTREVVSEIRAAGYSIRTTLLTGFPGETDADFRKLAEFVKETRFERLGAFAYSKEEGTPAASLPDQVPAVLAEKRRGALLGIQKTLSLENNRALVGTETDVIVDEVVSRSRAAGRTLFDAPDIDNRVVLRTKRTLKQGEIVRAVVTKASEYEIEANVP